MSVIRPRPPTDPLLLEPARGAEAVAGLVTPLAGPFARMRADVLAEPGGLDLAACMLDEYDTDRPASRLFAILQAARRVRERVDRLVIVAGGGIGAATRLLAASCCHPCHDQLPRGERGGRPRLSWLDGTAGSDELLGLLDLLAPPGRSPLAEEDLLDRWAVFVADDPVDDPGTLAIAERLLEATRGQAVAPAAGFLAVSATGSRLAGMASAAGCAEWFRDVQFVGAPVGVFSAAGLLPVAIAGIDIVQLLKGAAAMLVRFREAADEVNPVLVDAAVAWSASRAGRAGRRFVTDGRLLAPLAAWHHHLRPDRPSEAAAVTRIRIDAPRRAGLSLPASPGNGAASDLVAADVTIRLPRLDEHSLGQLFQLLILSRAVEERLLTAV